MTRTKHALNLSLRGELRRWRPAPLRVLLPWFLRRRRPHLDHPRTTPPPHASAAPQRFFCPRAEPPGARVRTLARETRRRTTRNVRRASDASNPASPRRVAKPGPRAGCQLFIAVHTQKYRVFDSSTGIVAKKETRQISRHFLRSAQPTCSESERAFFVLCSCTRVQPPRLPAPKGETVRISTRRTTLPPSAGMNGDARGRFIFPSSSRDDRSPLLVRRTGPGTCPSPPTERRAPRFPFEASPPPPPYPSDSSPPPPACTRASPG